MPSDPHPTASPATASPATVSPATASLPLALPSLEEYAVLEGYLGHTFKNRERLATALTHRSFVNEYGAGRGGVPLRHNERLEFLGDSVLGLLITDMLMDTLPDATEGQLSLARSQLISETSLAERARQIHLGDWLLLGRGEEASGGRQKPSLLADAFEAVFAALYVESGLTVCQRVAKRLFGEAVERLQGGGAPDQKSALQDLLQRTKRSRPRYEVVGTSGPEHDKLFEVAVFVEDRLVGQATGRSKRAAEQAAAERALAVLAPAADSDRPAPR